MNRQSWWMASCLLLALGCLTACSASRSGTPITPEPIARGQLKTRADVIRAWGIPENVRWHEGHRFYTYVFSRGKGGGLGLGVYRTPILVLGNMHRKTDSVVMEMDEQDRVVKIYTSFGSAAIEYNPLPFGQPDP